MAKKAKEPIKKITAKNVAPSETSATVEAPKNAAPAPKLANSSEDAKRDEMASAKAAKLDAKMKKSKGKKDEVNEIIEHHPEYADKKLSKHDIKEIHKVDHLEDYYKKPLHFHFLAMLLHLFVFAIATVAMVFLTLVLLKDGKMGELFSWDLSAKVEFIMELIIIVAFTISVAEFQLGWRRFFRIGRYERMRKAAEKNEKHLEKFKKKHLPKV